MLLLSVSLSNESHWLTWQKINKIFSIYLQMYCKMYLKGQKKQKKTLPVYIAQIILQPLFSNRNHSYATGIKQTRLRSCHVFHTAALTALFIASLKCITWTCWSDLFRCKNRYQSQTDTDTVCSYTWTHINIISWVSDDASGSSVQKYLLKA